MSEAIRLGSLFPPHKGELNLTHNEHKSSYRTVAQYIADRPEEYSDSDWVSEEQKAKAIETNELWTLHWYPETPIGFCLFHAADLEALLEKVAP